MIRFEVNRSEVILEYETEYGGSAWVDEELRTHNEVTVSRAFTFTKSDLRPKPRKNGPLDTEKPAYRFAFATRSDGYFCIAGRKLGIDQSVFIADKGIELERRLFVAERNVRIFRRVAKLLDHTTELVIGGKRDGAIPVDAFDELLNKFPNSIELDRYANARVEAIIGEHFEGMRSAKDSYETYLAKRKPLIRNTPLPQKDLLDADIVKFELLRDLLAKWLEEDKQIYSEKDWQNLILRVILLILPKYVAVLENVGLADYYSRPNKITKRRMDLALVDAGGNLDVIEIKRPSGNGLLGSGLYRDNNVPSRELSGCIMQVEKYLFHLSKWGVEGERRLTHRYQAQLPAAMPIRITNPKAMIILGRDRLPDGEQALTSAQSFDLEIIKRKYANLIDILTYDDLLRRLDRIIASLTKRRDETPPTSKRSKSV